MSDARWIAVLLAVTVGCRDGGEEGSADDPLAAQRLDEPGDSEVEGGPGVRLQDLVAAGRHRPPGAELAVLDRVDEPRRLEERAVANRHDPSLEDVIRTYQYADLSFSVYVVSETGKEILQRIDVSGADYRAGDGLRVGMTREAVVGIRGQPDRSSGDTEIYQIGGPMPGQVRVTYGDDATVQRMTWIFPVD